MTGREYPDLLTGLASPGEYELVLLEKLKVIYVIAFRLMGDETRASILLAAILGRDLKRLEKNESLECFLRAISSAICSQFRRMATPNLPLEYFQPDAFQRTLGEAHPEQRLAFILVTVAGFSYLECSVEMGVSVKMVGRYLESVRLSLYNSRAEWQNHPIQGVALSRAQFPSTSTRITVVPNNQN